jgi:peptidoglycan/xylan/chitin deacetylase (PgdA/CDA1 family)
MTWKNVREMLDSGLCEVASHSVSHRFMTALSDREVRNELDRSRDIIENETGFRPEAFFYPLGAHDRRVRRLTKRSGYRAAFVAHGGPTVTATQRFRIPRYDVKAELPLRTFQSFFNHEIEMSRVPSTGSTATTGH